MMLELSAPARKSRLSAQMAADRPSLLIDA